MRHQIHALLILLSVGWSTPLVAQLPDWVNDILRASKLPVATAEARREGVTSDEVRGVLDAMKNAGVKAEEAAAVIDTARAVRREHGPVDNFGAFVQSQLAAGKRGRELAAAIRAEHVRQGRGNAARGASGQGRGRGDTTAEKARGRGRGDTAAASARGRGDRPPDAPQKQGSRGRGRGDTLPPNH